MTARVLVVLTAVLGAYAAALFQTKVAAGLAHGIVLWFLL